jgi:hypothetical protein
MTSVAKTNQNPKFDPTNFNKNFEANDKKKSNLILAEKNLDNDVEIINKPHKEPVEKIILNIRDLFFQILNLVEEKENPLPYIFSSDKRQFAFSLFLIIFGTLLLLLSTLMKSPNEN